MLCKAHALLRQPIDVRRLGDRMPVATQVSISQIIGKNENDVGQVDCGGVEASRGTAGNGECDRQK
jgi:hypothetical protein